MKTLYKTVVILWALTVISCDNEKNTSVKDQSKPIPVTVAKVQQNDTGDFISASGQVNAINSANLSTRMMGYVERILVKTGDKVKKGQLLLVVNNADLQAKKSQVKASITEAQAAFKNAEKDYNRFKTLFEKNSASQKELDDITARYNMAKARLEAAKQMMNEVEAQFLYTHIKAPFAGTITNRFADEGAMANPGRPLLAIEAPSQFEVVARVPEQMINRIEASMSVNIYVDAIEKTLKGKVTEVSTSSANTGSQYVVKIRIATKSGALKSGMFANVQFPIHQNGTNSETPIMIEATAIISNGQLKGVYTVSQQQTAVLRWLRLGRTIGNRVEVLSGLSQGESYIVNAQGKLYNGAKITIQ